MKSQMDKSVNTTFYLCFFFFVFRLFPMIYSFAKIIYKLIDEVLRNSRLNFEEREKKKNIYRSISPKTTSIVPIIATISARKCFGPISCNAAKWAKPGAFILQRYGLLLPSLTR